MLLPLIFPADDLCGKKHSQLLEHKIRIQLMAQRNCLVRLYNTTSYNFWLNSQTVIRSGAWVPVDGASDPSPPKILSANSIIELELAAKGIAHSWAGATVYYMSTPEIDVMFKMDFGCPEFEDNYGTLKITGSDKGDFKNSAGSVENPHGAPANISYVLSM